jgi:hypothetical protein
MTTKWQAGDRLVLLDVASITCGVQRRTGDILIVKHVYSNGTPETTCGLTFYEHELGFIAKVAPEVPEAHRLIRDYFEQLVYMEDMLEYSGQHGGQHRQGWQSVKHTLDLLGIQIEGVNVKR